MKNPLPEGYKDLVPNSLWRHFKGSFYMVKFISYHTEEWKDEFHPAGVLVNYCSLKDPEFIWSRPITMWDDLVPYPKTGDSVRRFSRANLSDPEVFRELLEFLGELQQEQQEEVIKSFISDTNLTAPREQKLQKLYKVIGEFEYRDKFEITGRGTILNGVLTRGTVRNGAWIDLDGHQVKIVGIETMGGNLKPGDQCGLLLKRADFIDAAAEKLCVKYSYRIVEVA